MGLAARRSSLRTVLHNSPRLTHTLCCVRADRSLRLVDHQVDEIAQGCLLVEAFNEIDAEGGQYFFFCSNPQDCPCIPQTATEDTSWGSLKSLY